MCPSLRRARGVVGSALLVLVFPVELAATNAIRSDPEGVGYPCGVEALSLLGRLRGLDLQPERVNAVMGPPSSKGHSFHQLVEAGRDCGLSLRGIQLRTEDWPLDGPAILHLRRGKQGHFVVIRAVNRSNHLVQVLDPGRRAEVSDFDHLSDSPSWTGAALVLAESDMVQGHYGRMVGVASMMASLAVGALWRHMGRPSQSPGSE